VTTGVLLCGYGGPDSLEAVGPFMKNLMGFEPSPELLARVTRRYLAIGGSSPLTGIAMEIASELEKALVEVKCPMPVVIGMAYWDPFIADGLAALKARGCDRVIAVTLSPFESKIAHGKYRKAIDEAVAELGGLELVEAPLVSELDEFSGFFAASAASALSEIEQNDDIVLIFSAHSLPESDLVEGDPYVAGLLRTANLVAVKLGLAEGLVAPSQLIGGVETLGSNLPPRPWFMVYQSKGNRPGAWLGPDIDDIIDALASSAARGLVVVPIGFMTDHMETLYDLDIVAAGRALDADLEFVRAAVPNSYPPLVKAIASKIAELA